MLPKMFPYVPLELLDALSELFPEKIPDINDPNFALASSYCKGQRSVIELLMHEHKQQLQYQPKRTTNVWMD